MSNSEFSFICIKTAQWRFFSEFQDVVGAHHFQSMTNTINMRGSVERVYSAKGVQVMAGIEKSALHTRVTL